MNENNTGCNVTQYQDHCKKMFFSLHSDSELPTASSECQPQTIKFPAANVRVLIIAHEQQ